MIQFVLLKKMSFLLKAVAERAPKKRVFLVKFSKKCLKTPFLACFFRNVPAASSYFLIKDGVFILI